MRKRGLCCCPVSVHLSVCPSVCLSVKLVDCIQTDEDIVKLFVRSGSRIIVVFDPPPSTSTQFQGEPIQREHNVQGGICDFRLKSPFISVTVRYRSMVAMER